MRILVETFRGNNVRVNVEPTEKIMRIKKLLEKREDIHPSQQKLIYDGNDLDDDLTVQEAKIEPGAKIYLVLVLRVRDTEGI